MLVHLVPEQLACIGTIGIIESVRITRTYPVLQAVLYRLLVHPALLIKFLEMFGCRIEFRPYGNHHPSVHGVNRIYHCFRIGETCLVELVASPSVFGPVVPVKHDVVNRNPAVAEPFQGTQHFGLRIVFLTALPIPHRPFRHNRRLARQRTVAADDLVHIVTRDKIIIQLLRHFAPPRLLALFFRVYRTVYTKSGIRYGSVGNPFHFERHTLSGFQIDRELIAVRVPRRTPTFRHYQFIIDIHLCITGIVQDELEFSAFRRFDRTFIRHLRTIKRKIFRQVWHLLFHPCHKV